MTCNTQRAEINKPIIWSVTATDTGVSLSLPLIISVKNVPLVQQKPGVIKHFKQFHEMVAQVNKVHTVTVAPNGLL